MKVRVEPDPANRGLYVVLFSHGYETSSFEQLEGAEAPRTRWREFTNVPEGEYDAVAVVDRGGDDPWQDRARVSVLGR